VPGDPAVSATLSARGRGSRAEGGRQEAAAPFFIEDAAEYLGIPAEHVRACMRYYADFQDEIDEWAARARAVEEREEANWRRQQELLA